MIVQKMSKSKRSKTIDKPNFTSISSKYQKSFLKSGWTPFNCNQINPGINSPSQDLNDDENYHSNPPPFNPFKNISGESSNKFLDMLEPRYFTHKNISNNERKTQGIGDDKIALYQIAQLRLQIESSKKVKEVQTTTNNLIMQIDEKKEKAEPNILNEESNIILKSFQKSIEKARSASKTNSSFRNGYSTKHNLTFNMDQNKQKNILATSNKVNSLIFGKVKTQEKDLKDHTKMINGNYSNRTLPSGLTISIPTPVPEAQNYNSDKFVEYSKEIKEIKFLLQKTLSLISEIKNDKVNQNQNSNPNSNPNPIRINSCISNYNRYDSKSNLSPINKEYQIISSIPKDLNNNQNNVKKENQEMNNEIYEEDYSIDTEQENEEKNNKIDSDSSYDSFISIENMNKFVNWPNIVNEFQNEIGKFRKNSNREILDKINIKLANQVEENIKIFDELLKQQKETPIIKGKENSIDIQKIVNTRQIKQKLNMVDSNLNSLITNLKQLEMMNPSSSSILISK